MFIVSRDPAGSQVCRRRAFLGALIGGAATLSATAQAPAPPPISPDATPRDWSGQQPVRYPDPDVIALDNAPLFVPAYVALIAVRRDRFALGAGAFLLRCHSVLRCVVALAIEREARPSVRYRHPLAWFVEDA